MKLPHKIAAPAGMIGASNFFELSVAVAVALFGTTSPGSIGYHSRRTNRSTRNAVPCKNRKWYERPVQKMVKKKVAFICVHNSCRSQIAEALGKHFAADKYDFYSAGTETKPQINQDAVRLMKQLYDIDMEQTQYSKTIDHIPTPDIAISMGCRCRLSVYWQRF